MYSNMAIIEYIGYLFLSIVAFLWFNRNCVAINWPFLGMIPSLFYNVDRVHDFITHLLQQHSGTFFFKGPWFTGMDYLFTSDHNVVHHILNKNCINYKKGTEFREFLEALGDGILVSDTDSDSWRAQSKMLLSLFNQKWYEQVVERVMEHKILTGLTQVLDKASKLGTVVDLQEIIHRVTFDNICAAVVGVDPDSTHSIRLSEDIVMQAFLEMEEAMFYRHLVPMSVWKLQRWLQIGTEKKYRTGFDTLSDFVDKCITKKREQLDPKKTKTKDSDLLSYFLEMEQEESEYSNLLKSENFLKDMVFNFLGAGSDTIAAGAIWVLWVVSTHPLVEQKILQEIKSNLQEHKWRPLSFEQLRKLTYLHAVICETLRLYPPVPFDHVVSVEPDTLPNGCNIGKKTRIVYCLYSMGRMEEIWGQDYMEFKPERWISERGHIKHVPSYKFTVFNAGQRTCLGKNLAFLQIKAIVSAFLWNFGLQVADNHVVAPSNHIILYMKNGLRVKISKRLHA